MNSLTVFRGLAVLTIFIAWGVGSAAMASTDPVLELREAVAAKKPGNSPEIQDPFNRLSTISELRRALQLSEWAGHGEEEAVRVRLKIARKFLDRIAATVESKQPAGVQQAIAGMIGSLGREELLQAGISSKPGVISGQDQYIRSRIYLGLLAKQLVRMLNNEDVTPELRVVIARSLGNIVLPTTSLVQKAKRTLDADTTQPLSGQAELAILVDKGKVETSVLSYDEAAKALSQLIQKDRTVMERRAAAAALRNMAKLILILGGEIQGKRGTTIRLEDSFEDIRELGAHVVPQTQPMLADSDREVRRLGLETVEQVGFLLRTVASQPLGNLSAVTLGRRRLELLVKRTVDQLKNGRSLAKRVSKVLGSDSFLEQLTTGDPVSRYLSRRALEHYASARKSLNDKIQLAIDREYEGVQTIPKDALKKPLAKAAKIVSKRLDEPNAVVRLAGVQFLELLEDTDYEADPLLAERLAKRLKDQDRFVRWATIRALGNLGERRIQTVLEVFAEKAKKNPTLVPNDEELGLLRQIVDDLTSLLGDQDPGVRIASATSLLELRIGAERAPASSAKTKTIEIIQGSGPALVKSALNGDPDPRVKALEAFRLIGLPTKSLRKRAVDTLVKLLTNSDREVRIAAANAIGSLGADAITALPELEKTLRDVDAEVRRAASDAILDVSTPRRTKI
ncbi:MAG: HEAT repeat domain-containing protein [Gemmataceae bacterium]